MRSYADRVAAWDAAVGGVAVPASDNSVDIVTGVLEKQYDRSVAAIKLNDDKAGIVIPAVGVISGVVGSSVRPDIASQPVLALIGIGAFIAGVAAIGLAVVALSPKRFSSGPVALSAVRGAGVPAAVGKVAYLKALGFAVQSVEDVAGAKAFWVQWAFRTGAIGVIALSAFAVLGGFVIGGTSK